MAIEQAQINWISILLILIIVFLIAIILVYLEERKIKKKIRIVKNDKTLFYKKKISSLKRSRKTPQENIAELNFLAKSFFKDILKINAKENIEIMKALPDEKNKNFWKMILEHSYAGEKVTKKEVNKLISIFESLVRSKKI